MNDKICEYCGCKETEENPIEYVSDPYDSEINGNYTKHYLCLMCYNVSCDEI